MPQSFTGKFSPREPPTIGTMKGLRPQYLLGQKSRQPKPLAPQKQKAKAPRSALHVRHPRPKKLPPPPIHKAQHRLSQRPPNDQSASMHAFIIPNRPTTPHQDPEDPHRHPHPPIDSTCTRSLARASLTIRDRTPQPAWPDETGNEVDNSDSQPASRPRSKMILHSLTRHGPRDRAKQQFRSHGANPRPVDSVQVNLVQPPSI